MLGEDRREDRRHVLHDERRHLPQRAVEAGEDLGDRTRPARRGADEEAARRDRRARARRRGGGATRFGLRRGRGAARAGEPFDLRDELLAEAERGRDLAVRRRLRQVVERAERQAFQRDRGIALGQRRDHDHGKAGLLLEQPRQRADAVELGHVEVEEHDVGRDPVEGRDREPPVRHGRDHLDAAFLQPPRDEAAHDDGIVRDQNPDPVRRG